MKVQRVIIESCQNPKALVIHTIDSIARDLILKEVRKYCVDTWMIEDKVIFPNQDVVVVAANYNTEEVKQHLEKLVTEELK